MTQERDSGMQKLCTDTQVGFADVCSAVDPALLLSNRFYRLHKLCFPGVSKVWAALLTNRRSCVLETSPHASRNIDTSLGMYAADWR